MEIGPFTISRGTMIPYVAEFRTDQVRKKAADGSVTVVEQAFTEREEFFRAKVKIPRAEGEDLANFLDAKGFARDTFTYKDGFGVSFTVRFWDRRIRKRYITGGLMELDLLFRKENVAP